MTAIISNMADYRVPVEAEVAAFADYPDNHIKTRHTMLQMVAEGRVDLTENAIVKAVFPNGYDPVNHFEDNIAAVHREGVRRGVFESQ